MSGDCLQAVLTKVQVWMRQLRHVISNKSLVQARWEKVQAFISSRLDLCSALLHGLPDTAETPAIGTVCYRMAINQCTTARPHHTDTRQYDDVLISWLPSWFSRAWSSICIWLRSCGLPHVQHFRRPMFRSCCPTKHAGNPPKTVSQSNIC